MPKQTIGEFLATQRKAKGYTQQQVADMIGVSNRTLSSWEQGRSYPDIMTLPALAEIFGVTVDEILAGERSVTTDTDIPNELTQKSQKKILKNTLNKYSVKCTCLTAIGIGGPFLVLLSVLLMSFVPAWLTILLWILAVIDIMVVAVLFAVFEKSALIIEEDKSRFTLAIKCSTYKGVFYVGFSWLACLSIVFIILISAFGSMPMVGTIGFLILFVLFIPSIVIVITLLKLKYRSKELYSDGEKAILMKNDKLAAKLALIGFAIIVACVIIASIFEYSNFSVKESIVTFEKNEFIRYMQTVQLSPNTCEQYEVEASDDYSYFIDVAAAYKNGLEKISLVDDYAFASFWESEMYNIEGNLYLELYFHDGYSSTVFYVFYDEDFEAYRRVRLFTGRLLYLDGYTSFCNKYPEERTEDCIGALQNGEVVICFNDEANYFAERFVTYSIFGTSSKIISSYYSIELSGDNYTLVCLALMNYSNIVNSFAIVGCIITIVVCLWIYFASRKKIEVSI